MNWMTTMAASTPATMASTKPMVAGVVTKPWKRPVCSASSSEAPKVLKIPIASSVVPVMKYGASSGSISRYAPRSRFMPRTQT